MRGQTSLTALSAKDAKPHSGDEVRFTKKLNNGSKELRPSTVLTLSSHVTGT